MNNFPCTRYSNANPTKYWIEYVCYYLVFLAAFFLPSICNSTQIPQLTLPPMIYGVPGLPISIYFDDIILSKSLEKYHFNIISDLGETKETRWTVIPNDFQVGVHRIKIEILDASNMLLEVAETQLYIAPRDAGFGKNVRILIVGDSLTAATVYPNEIANLLEQPFNPAWRMLGTKRSKNPDVFHEGYGDWTWDAFLNRYDSASTSNSPFIYINELGSPALNLPRYFQEECDNQAPDVVFFLLGINDCFHVDPDDPIKINARINQVLDTAEKLLSAFHIAAPNAVLAIGLTPPPNARESSFENNYRGRYTRWGWKKIQHALVKRMIQKFENRQHDGIHLVPIEINIDPENGYPENNSVHPNDFGYLQIATSFYVWLKNMLNS